MSDVLSAFRSVLLESSDLMAVIGDRIVPDVLAQGETMPAVTIRRISTTPESDLEGTEPLSYTRITVECFSHTRVQADQISRLVRRSGVLDWIGVRHGVDCRGVIVDSGDSHRTEDNTEGSHELRYITEQDFEVAFIEDI